VISPSINELVGDRNGLDWFARNKCATMPFYECVGPELTITLFMEYDILRLRE